MDFGIKNSLDLYKRLTPAMNCKVRELSRYNMKYVKKEDIWNYLLKEKWNEGKKISLAEMVDDILNLDNGKLDKFIKRKLEQTKTNICKDEVELL